MKKIVTIAAIISIISFAGIQAASAHSGISNNYDYTESFAHDKESNQLDYKSFFKDKNEIVFPEGHGAPGLWQNHCYWVEEDNFYFCG